MAARQATQAWLQRLPAAAPARPDFWLIRAQRHILLIPASSRGAWFLTATPLAEPAALIPRIGNARLLCAPHAHALLPQLAELFRLAAYAPFQPFAQIDHDHNSLPDRAASVPRRRRVDNNA